MKFIPLIWSMLWRRRARTVLTAASIAAAFMLYGMLQAVGSTLALGGKTASADTLLTTNRYGFGKPLPYAYRSQIEAIPGVRNALPGVIAPFSYQDTRTSNQPSMAIDPEMFRTDRRFVVAPDQLKAFEATRTGIIVGRDLATKYGWKIGDRITLTSHRLHRADGGTYWDFDMVGLFDYNTELLGEGISTMRTFVRYDYIDEARAPKGGVDLYFVHVKDVAQVPAVAKQIDAMFQNSENPSKTQTESEQQRSMMAQIGDIGAIIRAVLSAVFFTLVVVAGNTMMRSFRERIPELAVLKTLGFTDAKVAVLVGTEALLLCVGSGALGLGLAWLILKPVSHAIAAVFPVLRMGDGVVSLGITFAFALGVVSAVIPVWHSARLNIVSGLSRR